MLERVHLVEGYEAILIDIDDAPHERRSQPEAWHSPGFQKCSEIVQVHVHLTVGALGGPVCFEPQLRLPFGRHVVVRDKIGTGNRTVEGLLETVVGVEVARALALVVGLELNIVLVVGVLPR